MNRAKKHPRDIVTIYSFYAHLKIRGAAQLFPACGNPKRLSGGQPKGKLGAQKTLPVDHFGDIPNDLHGKVALRCVYFIYAAVKIIYIKYVKVKAPVIIINGEGCGYIRILK